MCGAADTNRFRQLRSKVMRLAGIHARAEVEKRRPHDAFRDLLVDAAELGDALHDRRESIRSLCA
jgi:hypothetical protein